MVTLDCYDIRDVLVNVMPLIEELANRTRPLQFSQLSSSAALEVNAMRFATAIALLLPLLLLLTLLLFALLLVTQLLF